MTLEEAYQRKCRVEVTFREGFGYVTGPGPLEIVRCRIGQSVGPWKVYLMLRRIDSWGGYQVDEADIVSIKEVFQT